MARGYLTYAVFYDILLKKHETEQAVKRVQTRFTQSGRSRQQKANFSHIFAHLWDSTTEVLRLVGVFLYFQENQSKIKTKRRKSCQTKKSQ